MKVKDYTKDKLATTIIDRLQDIEQRERIVLKFPFGSKLTRIEIYCSETTPNDSLSSAMFGEKFNGIVTLQSFSDYSNKPCEKSSYSYKNELIKFIPKLTENIFTLIN